MRILVHGCSGKILGGIETYLLNMSVHMSDECLFDYIIFDGICSYEKAMRGKGGRIYYVASIRKNPIRHFLELWRLLKTYKSEGQIIYFNLFSMAHFTPILMSRIQGYSVILHAHNNGLQNKNLLYKLLHLTGKALLRSGPYIRWTNSRLSSAFMFGKGVEAELIYNAIDAERFLFQEGTRENIRAEYDAGNSFVIGFVGRLSYQKNPIFMLEVFSKVIRQRKDAMLWIIGEGELEKEMRKKSEELGIASSIKWFGRRSDIPELLMGMDVFLLPSVFEGLGIALIEAQAAGLPCVTSDAVVPAETKVTDLLNFVSLRSGSSKWAEAVILMYEDYKDDDRTRFNALLKESGFNIASEAERVERLLSDIDDRNCRVSA